MNDSKLNKIRKLPNFNVNNELMFIAGFGLEDPNHSSHSLKQK